MSKWIKIVDPLYINNEQLLFGWVKFNNLSEGSRNNERIKVRKHNDKLIIKVKPKFYDFFIQMWKPNEYPDLSLTTDTDLFYDEETLKKARSDINTSKGAFHVIKEFLWEDHLKSMSEQEIVDWFQTKHGFFDIKSIKVVEEHYVDDLAGDLSNLTCIMNIVSSKLLFEFNNEDNMLLFKLTWC